EEAIYEAMFIRDVNNYIAVKPGGETKRKGAYQLKRDLAWHQNHSATIVREAAVSHLVYGVSYEEYIPSHPNAFDFFMRVKASGGHRIMWGDEQMPRITRYYVSTAGRPLQKIMPAAGPVGQYKKANGVSQRDYDAWHHAWGNTYNPEVHTKNQSV